MNKRLALGLSILFISTVGLYAVNKPNTNIQIIQDSEEFKPIQVNVMERSLPNRGNFDRQIIPFKTESLKSIEATEDIINLQSAKEQIDVIVSAYTLSKIECGKNPWDKGYGITKGGIDLRGKNWQTAKVIAVDINIIPLHSIVFLEFYDEKYKIYSGEYIACDIGSGIKGNRIDLFYDEFDRKSALKFGLTNCKMTIIKYNNN